MKITHSKYGDRWDLLAYDIYGDSSMASQLMLANGALVSHNAPIKEGTEIVLPEMGRKENKITQINAPWKV